MNILYYYWTENSADDMITSLERLGHRVKKATVVCNDYDHDMVFAESVRKELKNAKYDAIFTFDFFPIISKVAEEVGMPYISWIYDMPHLTLFSPQLKNSVNHIFIFDYTLYNALQAKGYPCHLYHMPLPVNTTRIVNALGEPPQYSGESFEVSFVGSLYEGCLYNKINYLPQYIKGYLDGIIEAQQKVYGYNMLSELLNDDIIQEISRYVELGIPDEYDMTYKMVFSDMLDTKITSVERINLLRECAKYYRCTLFSGSDKTLVPGVEFGGIVDYIKEMPGVFRTSKINLNITLRSIISGISLRAMDIMGAGGFLLSNYQAELAEFFVDGEDCVLFAGKEDMLGKIEYYLSHDKERTEIACNGFRKVKANYSYEVLIRRILGLVFGG